MTTQEGKTALITGSYGELGTQFVNIHASRGGDLILVGRNAKKLADQQKEVRRKYNVTAHIIDVDLSQPLRKRSMILAKRTVGLLTT